MSEEKRIGPYIITPSDPLKENKCPRCGTELIYERGSYIPKCPRCEED